MSTLPILLGALCIYALAYRFYSAFLAAKVLSLDDNRITPAHRFSDGHNFVPSPRWVLFGHHFAAIAGAGPLVGPTLAAQFGFAPGLLWLLAGAVLAGCVQDFVVLAASVRHQGRSLPHIVLREIDPFAGLIAMLAVLFILLVTMAGLGIVVVNALANSPWGVFTIGMTIPIALIMGWWMFRSTPGIVRVKAPSIFGVLTLIAALIAGRWFANSALASTLLFSGHQITTLLMAYGFLASVLPVWLLLEPRDYLSTYVKLGTIAALILGVFLVHPHLQFPAFTPFIHGGGPIIHGKLFPFLFVTIACGAISGFHSLISSGTTPKLLDRETDARFIGYGAMLAESLVGVLALIAACSLHPGDYFAINVSPAIFSKMGLHIQNLDLFSKEVGEQLAGRTGGAVSLAIGMAQIFRGLPGMTHLIGYWYHYAIMFEALFILTTIDAGTRVSRYVFQELMGRMYKPFGRSDYLPGNLIATGLVVSGWGYLLWGGTISTIWPLFGTSNQLLATIALATMTTYFVNRGKAKYAWTTALPAIAVGITTISAGVLSIRNIFWPLTHNSVTAVQGYVDSGLMSLFILGVILIVIACTRRCWLTLHGTPAPYQEDETQEQLIGANKVQPMRCC